ncbi:uncharacterized protein EDB91DRAFT_1256498 [Suillus paluster]|uniref:uncharacterized protein n=1 Tax=Suillus paluster TaxID=48578 RepID=UPI001B86A41E|nr:uncharacterized protein EDB91DRAFT_1256498 [Suillus paluster]KAG1721473.1 hypothetical protein EDB91DRAFT_1256498 [Suillus paluster]
MSTAEFSNTAIGNATEQVMKIVQEAAKLKDGHPDHLKLAVEIGDLMSLVFKTHAMSVTTILLILLSAAMEMLEHLDAMQQPFASVPAWNRITTNNPQIQQHPLKEKARSIAVARPKPQPVAAAKASTAVASPAQAKGIQHRHIPPPRKPTRVQKRCKGSNTSSLPIEGGAPQHQIANTTETQTKTSKHPKVTTEAVSPVQNPLKEDVKADMDGSELVPPCASFVVKDMVPHVPNFELVVVAPGKNSNVLMPNPNLTMAEDMLVSENDVGTATAAMLMPLPATSVPPITTLEVETPPAAPSASLRQDPLMVTDDSGDGLTKVLQEMLLEVIQESANLSAMNATLRDSTASLRASVTKLQAENTASTTQLKTLEARITTQDAALLELQGLRAEVETLQDQVKTWKEKSATRQQHLRRVQDQLGQQELATSVLRDAYNAIWQHLMGQPGPLSSPLVNSLYLTNPMYGGGQSMVPISMGQMQAMEGLYFNLPSSVGNISSGSILGGPSTGPSVTTNAGSTHTGSDTMTRAASGVGTNR